MPRWFKRILGTFALMTVAACSGATGESCSGMQPLPAGFDPALRIENAASVRVTEAGFHFFETHLAPLATQLLTTMPNVENGVLSYPIERVDLNPGAGTNITVCIDGPNEATDTCIAEIDIGSSSFSLSSANPSHIVAKGTVPLRLKVLPIEGTVLWIPGLGVKGALSGGGKNDCNPNTMTFAKIPLQVAISIQVERNQNHKARVGYSKLSISEVNIDENEMTNALHFCGGGLDDDTLNALKPLVGGMVIGGFRDTVVETMNKKLCLATDPTKTPSCPDGTTDKDGICTYADGACASMMLGLDGHVDLGALLASFSPGTKGALDVLFAVGGPGARSDDPASSWGDLNPVANGATLGMFGGVAPRPVSNCVTPVELTLPTGIPQPNELFGNAVPGWTGDGPHVGFALSERFVNYALGAAYNSGLLCLGISTEQVGMLSSGLFSLIIPSFPYLTHQKQSASVALVVRPQQPPTITLGAGSDIKTDPLFRVALPQAVIDFYVWSSDRFVRAFTVQFDLDVPINLTVSAEGLTPVLDKIYVNNAVVTNTDLLKDDPAMIASSLANLVEGLAGDFLGNIPAFQLSDMLASFGLTLDLQQAGIKKLHKGNDNFLGVFAGLGIAPAITSQTSSTSVEILEKFTTYEGFQLVASSPSQRPRIVVQAYSSLDHGSNSVEYSYKVDRGLWHSWRTSSRMLIDDPILMLQGNHTIAVKSRLVDQPRTEDPSPVLIDVRLDVLPPRIDIDWNEDGTLRIDGSDIVSSRGSLVARIGFDDRDYGAWSSVEALASVQVPKGATMARVEMKDEEGNVASKKQALIRGRASKIASSSEGCGCMVPRPGGWSQTVAWLVGLSLFGVGLRRHGRPIRRALASVAITVLAGSWVGCSCSDDTETQEGKPDSGTPVCGSEGMDPCVVLEPGLVGAYTSADVAPDGTLWVSGYNEADWEGNASYGDLVVGRWNGSSVDWVHVDGVPDEEVDKSVYDVESWRGGLDSPGLDVGLWTSLKVDGAGLPRVAYFNLTNKSLEFASFDGTEWTVSNVFRKADTEAGRYAKLLMVGGVPTIAFQLLEPGKDGYITSRVVLAHANSATPTGPGDWVFEDVALDAQTPCRDRFCLNGQKCFAETGQCASPTKDCDPKCPSGEACFQGACMKLIDGTKIDAYPEAIGGYISMAQAPDGSLGIVYYDRIRGNLVQAKKGQDGWTNTVLDGQSTDTPPVDTGDVGIGASLAIDSAGDWHIAYVDGVDETLKYMRLSQHGTTIASVEVVDDGTGTEAGKFTDGRHIVGDDANITISVAGDVRIAYQDATAGTLRWAVGVPSGSAAHTWTRKIVQQDGFAGFFPQQVVLEASTKIVNWWRKGGAKIEGDVRVVTP
ncbi:MAG TPA: hypothetical protein PKL73_21100 [Polyangiaceae bacterium]|nr:hypothetical protein [Polyangiaceae bacterium]HNZ21821.1 hypothetical protein [Polyangiaceae bacterium]HOE48700.1 hypothetical protein [Polyangiaceae bacterium]HOG99618.1 hypothetical protein [Polyangiaceae bacterium]HOR35325.1 hypothetical protein [Polyangiaceae bacterium]